MKFSRLAEKFEKLSGKHKKGSAIKPDKLDKLRQLLGDKKSRYREKLDATDDSDKRQKLKGTTDRKEIRQAMLKHQ